MELRIFKDYCTNTTGTRREAGKIIKTYISIRYTGRGVQLRYSLGMVVKAREEGRGKAS